MEDLIEQANIRISILEKQRNEAMNQTLNALTELNIVMTELERTRETAHILANRNAELTDANIELSAQLNTLAESQVRARTARPRKGKTNG